MQGAGVTSVLLTSSIQYIINVIMTLPAILFIDRWGRRPTLIIGAAVMSFWLFLVGGIMGGFGEDGVVSNTTTWVYVSPVMHLMLEFSEMHMQAEPLLHAAISLWLRIHSFILLLSVSFATTWGPVSWTYPAEIFSANVRAKAVAFATSSNWAFNFALAYAVPPMLQHIKYNTYFVFAAINLFSAIVMFLFAHETKQRTLEEMDEVFDSSVPAWRSSKIKNNRLEQLAEEIALDPKVAEAEAEHYPVVAVPAPAFTNEKQV
jgi:MFS family permease